MSMWFFASLVPDRASSKASLPSLPLTTGGYLVHQGLHEEMPRKSPDTNPTALITRHGEHFGLEMGITGRCVGLCPDCL